MMNGNITEMIPLLIPVLLIQLGLQAAALVSLVRRNRVRFNNKMLWALIIVLGGTIGSIVYFAARGDE